MPPEGREKTEMKIITFLIVIISLCFGEEQRSLNHEISDTIFSISKTDLRDKIKGGWLGKIAGVCIGTPVEFKAKGYLYEGKLNFTPLFWRAFIQDDLYVQILFIGKMDALLSKGIYGATMNDYGCALKDAPFLPGYDNAGNEARRLLRNGILPPFSGRCAGNDSILTVGTLPDEQCYNKCADNLDWQISCDWIGLMSPAMPVTALRLNDTVGHVMSSGDGLYGGYFISTMISLAFMYSYRPAAAAGDIEKIVKTALALLPEESPYHSMVEDVITFKETFPSKDYRACWAAVNYKYLKRAQDDNILDDVCLSAALNGAFAAIGLLYGKGDIERTIEIAIRCGQDSDCNPGSAGAVIGTLYGYRNLPKKWRTNIELLSFLPFLYAGYTYNHLLKSSFNRAERAILQEGGTCSNGTYKIAVQYPEPPEIVERYGRRTINKTKYNGNE